SGARDGANVKVTTKRSNEAGFSKNGNQYGDYMGIAAVNGIAYPIWCDHSTPGRSTEEIFVDPPLPGANPTSLSGSTGADDSSASLLVATAQAVNSTVAPVVFSASPAHV